MIRGIDKLSIVTCAILLDSFHSSNNMQTISETLCEYIEDSQLTYHSLAEATGISDGILSRFMREERSITLPTAEKLAEYFGLELRPVRKKS